LGESSPEVAVTVTVAGGGPTVTVDVEVEAESDFTKNMFITIATSRPPIKAPTAPMKIPALILGQLQA